MSFAVKKRIFDCMLTLLAAPAWVPVLLMCALAVLVLDGRPLFYVSNRQVAASRSQPVIKFRTMRRGADKLVNRDTVAVNGTRFLNIPFNSDIYTPVGRQFEQMALTELPQLLHVLGGSMSLVGNRPLPGRVMDVLREANPEVDDRFLSRAGLVGPVQLVGRDNLTDADRLSLEIQYCRIAASEAYTVALDFWLLYYTVYVVLSGGRTFSVEWVRSMMHRSAKLPSGNTPASQAGD